jgi:hypothetical protein
MSDKRKTAVEWAFEQITNIDWKHLSDSDRNDLFDQAKQIEREQIEEAYKYGLTAHPNDFTKSNEYYEQTYGKYE